MNQLPDHCYEAIDAYLDEDKAPEQWDDLVAEFGQSLNEALEYERTIRSHTANLPRPSIPEGMNDAIMASLPVAPQKQSLPLWAWSAPLALAAGLACAIVWSQSDSQTIPHHQSIETTIARDDSYEQEGAENAGIDHELINKASRSDQTTASRQTSQPVLGIDSQRNQILRSRSSNNGTTLHEVAAADTMNTPELEHLAPAFESMTSIAPQSPAPDETIVETRAISKVAAHDEHDMVMAEEELAQLHNEAQAFMDSHFETRNQNIPNQNTSINTAAITVNLVLQWVAHKDGNTLLSFQLTNQDEQAPDTVLHDWFRYQALGSDGRALIGPTPLPNRTTPFPAPGETVSLLFTIGTEIRLPPATTTIRIHSKGGGHADLALPDAMKLPADE